MTFISDTSQDYVLDGSELVPEVPDGLYAGYEERDWSVAPYGEGYAAPFDIPVIPRDEWRDRIEEMEKTKSRLTDLCDASELTVLNQNGTNFCWANGPVHCVEILRLAQGQPMVRLSPASVAAPIKNYRNVGGWGEQALEYIVEKGIVSQELWPANAIDRRLDTDQSRKDREKYQVDEWWDLRPRDFDQLMTCLLLRIPVSVAYNWWRHLIMSVDPVALDGRFGIRVRNSWGQRWGSNGTAVFPEGYGRNRANPDEALAPRVVTAS
jgi:hypothetical protein